MKLNFLRKSLLGAVIVFLSGFCISSLFAEEPVLRVGCMTDTHIGNTEDKCQNIRKAFILFQQHKIDLMIHVGDIADKHNKNGYEITRRYINEIFKENKPKELWAYAFHDSLGDKEKWHADLKTELQVPNEPFDQIVLKGYPFLVFPQVPNYPRMEKMIQAAIKDHPGKPVFIVDHPAPAYTTENSDIWGGDVRRRRIMDKYPQIICFSGHNHNTLRNELCIWQGNFTTINCGCIAKWCGSTIGNNAPVKYPDEVVIMEIFPDKIYFRCYSTSSGKEIRPDHPWCIPLPFDPAKAPYNPQVRAKNSPAPAFDNGAAVTITPDKKPFRNLTVTFPEANHPEKCYRYRLVMSRKDSAGKWEAFNFMDCFGAFHLEKGPGKISMIYDAGYFDENAQYQLTVSPVNYYGGTGKPLTLEFTSPKPLSGTVIYENKDPVKELVCMTGKNADVPAKLDGGFWLYPNGPAQLNFPAKIWDGAKAGTRYRLIMDVALDQPERFLTYFSVSNLPGMKQVCSPIRMPQKSSSQRIVFSFGKKSDADTFYVRIGGGTWLKDPALTTGKISVRYVRIEKMSK